MKGKSLGRGEETATSKKNDNPRLVVSKFGHESVQAFVAGERNPLSEEEGGGTPFTHGTTGKKGKTTIIQKKGVLRWRERLERRAELSLSGWCGKEKTGGPPPPRCKNRPNKKGSWNPSSGAMRFLYGVKRGENPTEPSIASTLR